AGPAGRKPGGRHGPHTSLGGGGCAVSNSGDAGFIRRRSGRKNWLSHGVGGGHETEPLGKRFIGYRAARHNHTARCQSPGQPPAQSPKTPPAKMFRKARTRRSRLRLAKSWATNSGERPRVSNS